MRIHQQANASMLTPACFAASVMISKASASSYAATLLDFVGHDQVGSGCTAGVGASLQDIERLLAPFSQRPLATTTHPVSMP